MKHPVLDRLLMLLCALMALCAAAFIIALLAGRLSLESVTGLIGRIDLTQTVYKAAAGGVALLMALVGVLLISAMTPSRKKRSSNFAIQRNENGMVRISLKALETLVSKCLNQHAELKVITSSMYSDEESIRVDVHIALQSDISMPLAISALQKQIKRYIEACSGVNVQEVRVFVDSTIPATEETAKSPYAIPETLLHGGSEALTDGHAAEAAPAVTEQPAPAAEAQPEEENPFAAFTARAAETEAEAEAQPAEEPVQPADEAPAAAEEPDKRGEEE
ncbi:MAG: alkaline shock response membrane anchor protein AmaP [Clostridia bacterium]|nr:alkaline shock response membrane anchor protein AmaP [Clostridia bacterium]